MPTVSEASQGPQGPLVGPLQAGVDMISGDQEITFQAYVRVVLPLDGYLYWVKMTSLGSSPSSSLFNVGQYNTFPFNQSSPASPPTPLGVFKARGSLHYSTEAQQTEESGSSKNRVVFTSEVPVQNLNAETPEILYIATFDGPVPGVPDTPAGSTAIRFAFSSRASYYQQAGLWHYIGNSVQSTMDPQIIEDPRDLDPNALIVSNSLPAWLAFNYYNPPWPVPVPRPNIMFYPSFLVPVNLTLPYGVIHIDPAGTEVWQTMPTLRSQTQQSALAKDRVRITLYGLTDLMAENYLYSLLQYSFDTEVFGILNIPAVRDEKEAQAELHTLAKKKRIDFEVSYVHDTVRDFGRQLITSAAALVQVGDEIIVQP